MNSAKNSLNLTDLRQWAVNVVIFSAPALIAFLTALQKGLDYKIAGGMLLQAFIASLIDLLGKYKSGN